MNGIREPRQTPAVRDDAAEDYRLRLAREAALIAEAEADVAAGNTVSLEDIEAWIDSLGTTREKPVPQSGR
jgi:predicted transcriptional regulator